MVRPTAGTDHRTHDERNAAVAGCIRLRNSRSEPKSGFAPESRIRQWTEYPAEASGCAGKGQFPDGGL